MLYPILFVIGLILAVVTAWRKGSPFYTLAGILVALYGGLQSVEWVMLPPLPGQVVYMYMFLTAFFLVVYYLTTDESLRAFLAPIYSLIAEEKKRWLRAVVSVLLPLLGGYMAYARMLPTYEPPVTARIVHPEPPTELNFRGRRIRVVGLENPLRKEADKLAQYLEEGKKIYYENCFSCHGDYLDGKGHFAIGVNPLPLPFLGTDTIAQLPESMVFFRVAKGWSGLPEGSHPWDSTMPILEQILEETEIWKVILYIYKASGNKPRTWE